MHVQVVGLYIPCTVSIDVNMMQMRLTSNPAYDGLLMDTCVKRQRDGGPIVHISSPNTSILVSKFTLGSSIKDVRTEGREGMIQCGQKGTRRGSWFLQYFIGRPLWMTPFSHIFSSITFSSAMDWFYGFFTIWCLESLVQLNCIWVRRIKPA